MVPSLQGQKAYQWIASLYFFQSIPFVVVSLIATIMYQQQGMANSKAALLTSLLMLPWSLKPLFAPYLEHISTKKRLTIVTQLLASIVFFILALSVNKHYFLMVSILGFACLAVISSLHDIVSDGVYLLNLDKHSQKRYVAFRSFFYQMGRLVIKGGLLAVLGQLAIYYNMNLWSAFFYALFLMAMVLTIYHSKKIPEIERVSQASKNYCVVFKALKASQQFYPALIFIFLYNVSDAQMQKIIPLFLLDKTGLELSIARVSEIYGISGSLALMIGVFVSGLIISRYPIAACMKKLTIFLLLGHFMFIFLIYFEPSQVVIYCVILASQFVVGMTNGAYMGYLLSIANQSNYPMSMYTLCVSAMALSYVFFGAISGWIEEQLGYSNFFLYILLVNSLLVMMTYRMMNRHG
ncbi:beta lactamase induction signal transducer AmpG [Legionella nautarum]|uniref:Beta lactamase induction signal transducer AmpG n=1 Tax=Legionella nautarum TaxID=45070 RepID=A0A0W0WLM7_9GAMM|nr:beta lactamase induction signal transducer AmpG [Legionella nautarum]